MDYLDENEPDWPPKDSGAVYVRDLKRGDRFTCIQGERWTYERIDGALSGFHHATRDDGHKSGFAGCAEVVPLPA